MYNSDINMAVAAKPIRDKTKLYIICIMEKNTVKGGCNVYEGKKT